MNSSKYVIICYWQRLLTTSVLPKCQHLGNTLLYFHWKCLILNNSDFRHNGKPVYLSLKTPVLV